MTNTEVKEINKKSITVTDKRTGEEQSIKGDTVVVALGSNNGVFYYRSRRGHGACGFDPKGTTLLQLVGGERCHKQARFSRRWSNETIIFRR